MPKLLVISSRETPGVDVSAGTLWSFRAIKLSADEMAKLEPDIRERIYRVARGMRQTAKVRLPLRLIRGGKAEAEP